MPIIHKQGDLLQSDCNVIGHGCNCFCQMGSGIAKAIRARYPEVYQVDFFTPRGDAKKLGTFSKTFVDNRARLVYNLYSQYKAGTDRIQVDYEALKNALLAMKQDLNDLGIYQTCKLGLPRIGCGLAGGDWNIVSEIINEVFPDKAVWVWSL